MSVINEIFRTFGPEYLRRFGSSMPEQHRKVIADICSCRTEANSVTILRCPDCHHLHLIPRGCGNRHCPGCQQHKGQQWLGRQAVQPWSGIARSYRTAAG